MHIINYIFNSFRCPVMPAIIKQLVSCFTAIPLNAETNISLKSLILSACKMGTDGLRCNPSGACSFGYGVKIRG